MDTMRVNAQTILALNTGASPTLTNSSNFCWDLAIALAKPHMKRRRQREGIQARIIRNIDYILQADDEPVVQPVVQPVIKNPTRRRCAQCLQDIQGEGSKKKKDKLPKHFTCCNICHTTLCKVHSVLYCHTCDPAI